MRFRSLCVALGLWACAGVASAAPDTVLKSDSGGQGPATLHGELQLSLADAIAMGLENNLNVEIQRHAPLIAHADHQYAWGAYDPVFNAEFGYSDEETPVASGLVGTGGGDNVVKILDGWGGFSGLIPWLGTSYDARLTSSRNKSNAGFATLFPELRSEVSFAVTQPLMRGLIWSQPWTLVKTSREFELSALEQFRADVMDTVAFIEGGYWALIADDELVRVAEKSFETANALLDRVTTQYEVGVVSKVEIAESEAGVAEREFDLIVARNRYRNSMDLLIDMVLGASLTADSRITIEPTDRADEYVPIEVDVERAAAIAFERRPELAIAQHEIDRLILNVKLAKNERLPQLDARLGYGNRGLAGDPKAACTFGCPVEDPGGYGNSYNGFLGSGAAEQWSARAILSIPFPNTSARAGVSRAELELRRARTFKRRTEQDVILEIRRSARNLLSGQEGIEAADRRRAAAQEQLRAEETRLEYGESTPFDVLLREQDLVSAEEGYIGAFQVYRTSLTSLDRAQGTILRNRNVEIDRVAPLR
ncbi:MAG: TolC family protein [Deltaproteobacteria bacterium]|nr:TolC family protein [Deltaproteobacteria bacterium]MBW2362690.1 TolC family protein [Deltaproteobacteria bacterium]